MLLAAFQTVPAHVEHQSVAVYYCVNQYMQTEVSTLYVFESSTSDILGVWDKDNFDDPDAGLDAWLEDSVGTDWATHDVTFYEKVQEECAT